MILVYFVLKKNLWVKSDMCIATNGKIIEINDMNATIECKSNKINVRINPAIPVKVGDEVIVFRNIIIEKVL